MTTTADQYLYRPFVSHSRQTILRLDGTTDKGVVYSCGDGRLPAAYYHPGDGTRVQLHKGDDHRWVEVDESDAEVRLRKAAPALLAACRAALTALQLADQDVYDEGKTCAQLTAAIEQATSAKIHGAINEGRE